MATEVNHNRKALIWHNVLVMLLQLIIVLALLFAAFYSKLNNKHQVPPANHQPKNIHQDIFQ